MKDEQVFDLSVEAHLDQLVSIRAFIDEAGGKLALKDSALADLRLVVDEAVTNVIVHGYDGQQGTVDLQIKAQEDSVIITIRDQARPFDPALVNAPQLNTALEDRAFGGMGIFLIKQMTDEAEFLPLPGGGNELRLVKHGAIDRGG